MEKIEQNLMVKKAEKKLVEKEVIKKKLMLLSDICSRTLLLKDWVNFPYGSMSEAVENKALFTKVSL